MRTIQKRKKILDWEINVTCKKCISNFQLQDPEDIFAETGATEKSSNMHTNRTQDYCWICPKCSGKNKLSPKKIPKYIIKKIK